jgi:RNA polymerase sigma-70 factor (ECF subfamily)
MEPTDGEYVRRCLNGSPDEYRAIVERYQGTLVGYLGAVMSSPALAEEAAQETFVRAYFRLHKLKHPRSLHPWLLGIAGRVAKEMLRSRRRHGQVDPGSIEATRTEDPAAGDERDCMLRQAVGRLPDTYREAVLLRYYGGLSCRELADKLQMPLGTATKTLSRAYAMLRQDLQVQQARATRPMEVQR